MIGVPVPLSPYSLTSSQSDALLINKQKVAELYKQMKDQSNFQPSKSLSSANLTSLCVDISPSLSNFFEVFYIGKIKVWNRKIPETFIDDALDRFKAHELEKKSIKLLANIGRLKSEETLIRRASVDSNASEASSDSLNCQPLQRSISSNSGLSNKSQPAQSHSPDVQLAAEEAHAQNSNSNSNSSDDHNRTMLLQIDRTDLRLISPDRKIILLHKNYKDVIACVQGANRKEHFGFVCKESNGNGENGQGGYTGYVFKCKSDAITYDTVSAINQAFNSADIRPKAIVTSCEHCPMIWFHKLCTEIESLSDKKTQAVILRKIDQLDEDEQTTIMTKFRGAETDSIIEQNEFLMMLLRAHCEMKQGRHVHDTAENRSEFLNQYLGSGGVSGAGGGTIFMKAKRSLSNSFEMLKKRASREDFGATLREMNLPLNKENVQHSSTSSLISHNDQSEVESEGGGMRSRSSTIESQNEEMGRSRENRRAEKALKSPMMDIFFKVGSPRPNNEDQSNNCKSPQDAGSWRQAIFKKVVTPQNQNEPNSNISEKKSREHLRELWKKSIRQAILLVRMEKENAILKAKQEESAVKRIKLEYDEMKPTQREVSQVWDLITDKNSNKKVDKPLLSNAIRQGIPRGKRGEVWQFLAHHYCMNNPPVNTSEFPHYNTPYETLLKELTSHQHAILIDLGRTFPNHSYFSSPLGPGQLALFNLLKAYSLLDPEVGYCQGLSFVVGILLLHMEESQAFSLLKHLMFRRGLRKQYLPDMTGLQIRLYQLSRLLHDKLPDLYDHLNNFDISPSLYAAPWILTIFASQFPLGFVTRIFDLLFMEGLDIVFRVALALLTLHKENLIRCGGFEDIMDYLKTNLTQIDNEMLEKIIKIVYVTDISKKLSEYHVEYNVLQEETLAMQPQVEKLHRLELEIKRLKEQNKKLNAQLEMTFANVQRLEKGRTVQQSELNRQEMHTRGLEVTVSTLGRFINNLIDENKNIEIPGDVRRIVSQISFMEKRKNEKPQNYPRNLVKSMSTGKIQLNTPNAKLPEEFRTNSLNAMAKDEIRTSNFFSNQHNNILKQKGFISNSNPIISPSISNTNLDTCILTIKESDCEDNEKNNNSENITITSSSDDNRSNKNVNNNSIKEEDIKVVLDNLKVDNNHPLSNCDVNFTFNGTRELKHFKKIRARNSSPNLINPQ